MAKDNDKSNSELLQRLKLLLAESDKRQNNPPEETNQDSLKAAIQDLLSPPDEVDQESREEAIPDISGSQSIPQPADPPDEILEDIPEETPQDSPAPLEDLNQEISQESAPAVPSLVSNDIQESAPAEEVFEETLEESIQDPPASSEVMEREVLEAVPPDLPDIGFEIRQEEPREEVTQESQEKVELQDPLNNTLREGEDMPQVGNYVVNYKNIIVKTSDGSVITGKTNIDAFGRLTEYLKQGTDRFITVFSEDAGDKSKQVTIVNKDHIIWANTWD